MRMNGWNVNNTYEHIRLCDNLRVVSYNLQVDMFPKYDVRGVGDHGDMLSMVNLQIIGNYS